MKHILIYILPLLLLTSCLSETVVHCPPLVVTLGVKDKNYANIDRATQWEQRRDENLPFRSYIPMLRWELVDFATGNVMLEQENYAVDVDDPVLTLDICDCLPHGKYILRAYGNVSHDSDIADDGTLRLHQEDSYISIDTLLYDPDNNGHHFDMYRTEGKLIILVEGLPAGTTAMHLTAEGMAATLSPALGYQGDEEEEEVMRFDGTPLKTLLPPDGPEGHTTLHVEFTVETPEGDIRVPAKDVQVHMRRNELTITKYVYQPETQDFTIYLLVNADWQNVTNLHTD